MSPPLSQLRILDLSSDVCGPYTTKLFADAGAEVIKIEPPSGDPLRKRSFFHFLNTSKRSVVLDLESSQGREDFLRLAGDAHMVVEDLPQNYMEDLGIGHDVLRAENPELVFMSISHWGRGGPFGEYPTTEFTLQSWVGAVSYRGIPGEMPYGVGGQLADFMTAASAAAAALGAILAAQKTGEGAFLDVSKYEVMTTSFMTYHHILGAFDKTGTYAAGRSIEIPSIEPTADGWVGFCTITAQQFQDFCVLIEDPEMGEDERLLSFDRRMEFRDEAWSRISKYTSRHTTQEVIEKAILLRIPVAPIGTGESVLTTDHFVERGIYVRNPNGFQQPRIPYLMEKTKLREFEPAPELGQDTEAILNAAMPTGPAKEVAQPKNKPNSSTPATQNLLSGIRVCDLSAFWAGPLVGSFLGSLGAEVIKVESPKRPDGMRFAGSMGQDKIWEWSPVFHGANCNKYDLAIDILSEEGMGHLKNLISTSDLVVENYSPRVMENWGLTWEVIQELNPKAIMVRLPAFGLTGPWRDRTGFAMTIEQASGLAFRTGDPEGRPMVPRGICDPLGAMHTAFACLLALKHREETGEAQLIEVPLVEAGLNAASEQVVEWSANQNLLTRMGNRSQHIAPQGVYPCSGEDSWVCISMDKDELWTKLLQFLDSKELAGNPALNNLAERIAMHDQIDEAISNWTSTQARDSVVKDLTDSGIPAAPVITGVESASHPQLKARGHHQILEHPVAGQVPYNSFPVQFDGKYLEFLKHSPALGEHNHEILSRVLGLKEAEIAELEEKGVIGTEPNFG